MRIESVKAELLMGRPERGVKFAIGSYDAYSLVLVTVTTDEGVTGYGEAISRRGGEMVVAAVESLLAPVLAKQDPQDIQGLWVTMMDQLRRWGHAGGVVVEAISGVDSALWDVVGKATGQPIWRLLLGAGREHVPVYASSVYIDSIQTMVDEACEQVENGFSAIKIKIGRSEADGGVRADIESMEAIRQAVGEEVDLMADANGAYDAATAIRVARALEPVDLLWLEEPVPPDDLDGYRRVHSMTTTPLAGGESVFGVFGFRPFIADSLIDYVQPDLGRCGGITAAMQIYALCYAYNLRFAPHTGFSGGVSQLGAIHVAAAVPELFRLEYMFIDNPMRELFVGGYPRVENGTLPVPQGPGLGLDVDLDRVASFSTA